MCCPSCDCLGFCPSYARVRVESNRPGPLLRLMYNRDLDTFALSARAGCCYCDLVCQASRFLDTRSTNPKLDVRIYKTSSPDVSISGPNYLPPVSIYEVIDSIPQTPFFQPGEVPERSNSEETFSFLERCYKTCLQDHPKCQQPVSTLPRRVLDISTTPFKLTEPASGTQDRYVALSYRWGGWPNFTTKDTLEARKSRIEPESMPIVFQEVALIAQMLEISYLWIDNICIVQDDRDDWNREAAKMAEIYQSASIVIAASSVPNPGTSFLGLRDRPAKPSQMLSFPDHTRKFRARRHLNCGLHAQSPEQKDLLDQRGWCLQEKELGCRWVSYSASELQWRCKSIQTCECSSNTIFPQSYLSGNEQSPQELHFAWQLIVEDYTSRKLTDVQDKLPALMGLAKKFQQQTSATYLSGLWKENVIYDLAWKRDPQTMLHSSTHVGPTFSWASVLDGVTYQPARHSYPGVRINHTVLLEAQMLNGPEDFLSMGHNGRILVRGPTMEAVLGTSDCENPNAYTLEVRGQKLPSEIYFEPKEAKSGFEFSMDSIVDETAVLGTAYSRSRIQESSKEECESTIPNAPDTMPVKLLSLFSLARPSNNVIYEIFLILTQDPGSDLKYRRIGLGTGKKWHPANQQDAPQCRMPFLWVLDPMKAMGETEVLLTEDVDLG